MDLLENISLHYKQNIFLSAHLVAIVLSPLTLLGSPELIKNRIVNNTEDNILRLTIINYIQ